MNAATVARRLGRDLWHAVAWGLDEPPPLLRQVRAAATPGRLALLLLVPVGGWVLLSPHLVVAAGEALLAPW